MSELCVCVYKCQTLTASTQSVHSECIFGSFIAVFTMMIILVLLMFTVCVREVEPQV